MDQHRAEAAKLQQFYREQLLQNVVPFWLSSDLLDKTYGGYRSSVDREGHCYNSDKSVWFQGRSLWTFSALCARYGIREEWKAAAEAGKPFLENRCFDRDGRMFYVLTQDGQPLCKRHHMFSESFYVIGMAEYGATFGDADAIAKAEACFEGMLRMYDDPAADPYPIPPEELATLRPEREAGVPMVMVSTAQILRRCDPAKADYYTAVAKRMANDILTYHYHPELTATLENVLPNGSHIDDPTGRSIVPGHSSEIAWFLMNLSLCTGDQDMLQKALSMFDWSFERGWDAEHGGMLCFVDLNGQFSHQKEWDMKLWWVHNEVLIASLMAYGLTGDEKYWERFQLVHEYVFAHFPDKEYGEWYGHLHRDGTVARPQKGSSLKGPYHLPRCLMLCDRLLGFIAEGKEIQPIL